MDNGVDPQNSYRVLLDEKGKLYWETETAPETLRYDKDPRSTFWQRFQFGFLRAHFLGHSLFPPVRHHCFRGVIIRPDRDAASSNDRDQRGPGPRKRWPE